MSWHDFIFGRLSWSVFPTSAITLGGIGFMILCGVTVLGALTYYRLWGWLWREWLTSLDPKRIGVMYLVVAAVMLVRGGTDALMMRTQQATAVGLSHGILSADHFQQIFSAHGTIMIFFVAMGVMFGIINCVLPLQLGSRDVAFPFLNSLSFWFFVSGAILVNLSLVLGDFSAAGWLAYPPLSELAYSPTTGVDYWIWSLQIAGLGSLLSGVNFVSTIVKMRAKGMRWMQMPIFVWSVFGAMSLVMFAFPVLTVTLTLLYFDRTLAMHFFTASGGGNMMMYVNLIWAWGHPEVYILILPAFGIFSEIVPVFSGKKLAGYTSMVWSIVAIVLLSFTVWLHHFFTMGADAAVNTFFGITTAVIAIPTGVKIFNWLFTMYRGRIRFTTPMLWFMGFVVLFTLGGVTGVVLAEPVADYQLHNSLFLIAHFHTMIVAGVLFGFFAGITYWFPKMFGFRLEEKFGKAAFWCWLVGFILAFGPLYVLGFMGATRRLDHYSAALGWQPLFMVAGLGVLVIALGFIFQVTQMVRSVRRRHENRDTTGDPWEGRTLEWATPSPVPAYNFAHVPEVHSRDPYWEMKASGQATRTDSYEDIWVPRNSGLGLIIAGFVFLLGFGCVWHLWWLAAFGALGAVVCAFIRLFDEDTEMVISALDVARTESAHAL